VGPWRREGLAKGERRGRWSFKEMLMLIDADCFAAPEPRSKKDRKLKTEIEPLVKLEEGSS
jgi:hypothetical protein